MRTARWTSLDQFL